MNRNSSSTQTLTILVVDDHHLIREGTLSMIKQQYEEANLVSATNAAEAREIVTTYSPDIAIVDLSIPVTSGMSAHVDVGINLLKQLMTEHPELNLMVQSSNTKALVRLKHNIDNHQGGFTIADKSLSPQLMLTRLEWAIAGITHTKDLKADLEIKPEWLEVLQLAFEAGLQDKVIAQKMFKSERMIRHYWTKIQDVLEIYPEEGKNIRALTQIRAREEGLID